MTLARAAERVGVMPATLRRWIRQGLIPQYEDSWTPAAIGQARVVAKMRERGHSLTEIRRATEDGKLAFGFLEELFPSDQRYLQFFVEQDVVGHMESDLDGTAALTDWAVGFQSMQTERPPPRIVVRCGVALYRDGDYYGRDINIASRVAARSSGGEVLVTRPVMDAVAVAPHLEFERIGDVRLKGFTESTKVFVARQRPQT